MDLVINGSEQGLAVVSGSYCQYDNYASEYVRAKIQGPFCEAGDGHRTGEAGWSCTCIPVGDGRPFLTYLLW